MKIKNRPLRLLIIGSSQGVYGGIEAFMIALASVASEWPEFEVKLCFKLVKGFKCNDDLIQAIPNKNIKVFFVEKSSLSLFKLINWSDILHVQNTPPDVIFPARLLSKKIFLTIHNWYRNDRTLLSYLWKIGGKLANQRWYNSNFVWNTWEPSKKSPSSACIPTVCALPTEWIPINKRKGFLFVGRWIPNKGIEELLYAYAKCKFDAFDWPLTILGDGLLRTKILTIANQLGIEGLHMPGFVSDKIKVNYIASARWLVAPANTKEDLGLTPIEARSVGVPSIVTRDGGLPESAGPTALIAEPGNYTDLAKYLQIAAQMSESEYKFRSEEAKNSLNSFLKPMSFYRTAYIS